MKVYKFYLKKKTFITKLLKKFESLLMLNMLPHILDFFLQIF